MPIKRFIVNFYGCSEDKSGTITLLQKNCLSGCRIQSKPDFIRQRFSEVFQQPCQMAFVAEIPFDSRFFERGAPADGSGGTVEAEVAFVSAEAQSGKIFEQYRKTART